MKQFTKRYLIKEYKNKKRTMASIAKQSQCCSSTVYNYLKRYNIPTNDISREITIPSNKTILAYFAGIIDGEGSIHIGQTKSRNKKYPFDYKAYLQIGMTDGKIIKWIMKNIGGHYSKVNNKTVKSKESWNWWMNPYQSSCLLKKLNKYLIIKKAQANIMINYTKTLKQHGQKLNQKEYNYRQKMFKQMKILNKRGI